MISALKDVAKRHWPSLSLRTILFGTLLFVAALPGIGAVFLRVYENTLVQQTEAELIAQSAVLASASRVAWGATPERGRRPAPEPPKIDLRSDAVLAAQPDGIVAGRADPRAMRIGRQLAPVVDDAAAITLAATRLLDARGIVVAGRDDLGLSYAALPEVRRALTGQSATVLRERIGNPYGLRSPLEMLSRAAAIRVHHVRPVIVDGRIVGAVMLSRSPRGLFLGIYQDRGKIALGIGLILLILIGLAGVLSRGIARPIRALTAASEDVARGQVVIPDPPVTAAIEIRELYVNFAIMAERIDQRARYLRDFAAAVSHEFKTPLTGIRGALELLDEHGADMDVAQRSQFLANATADTDRLSRLVQRLLDLARADMANAADAGRCDAVAVTRTLAAQLRSDTLAITVDGPADLPDALLSADALATVLTTLIDNSRQAGADRIDIRIDRSDDLRVRVRVRDNGHGIPESDRERIFEPFFTGRRASGGTGLGLAIARSLLSATGGGIALSPCAAGTEILVMLPARHDQSAATALAHPRSPRRPSLHREQRMSADGMADAPATGPPGL